MTLPPPLTLPYWFTPYPSPFLPVAEKALYAIFIACLVFGTFAAFARMRPRLGKMTRRALSRGASLLITMGGVGLVLMAIEYQRISFLRMRVFYLVWAVVFIVWASRLYRFVTVEIPAVEKKREERERIEKWLPKRKP